MERRARLGVSLTRHPSTAVDGGVPARRDRPPPQREPPQWITRPALARSGAAAVESLHGCAGRMPRRPHVGCSPALSAWRGDRVQRRRPAAMSDPEMPGGGAPPVRGNRVQRDRGPQSHVGDPRSEGGVADYDAMRRDETPENKQRVPGGRNSDIWTEATRQRLRGASRTGSNSAVRTATRMPDARGSDPQRTRRKADVQPRTRAAAWPAGRRRRRPTSQPTRVAADPRRSRPASQPTRVAADPRRSRPASQPTRVAADPRRSRPASQAAGQGPDEAQREERSR